VRYLGEMLGDDAPARCLGVRVARETKDARALLEPHEDLPAIAADTHDLRPRDAHVERTAKLKTVCRQQQVSDLVGAPAAEPDGTREMARVARCQASDGVDQRTFAAQQAGLHVQRFDTRTQLRQVLTHFVFAQAKFRNAFDEALESRPGWGISNRVQLMAELSESSNNFASGELAIGWKSHSQHQ
jgi:hypothetical protein